MDNYQQETSVPDKEDDITALKEQISKLKVKNLVKRKAVVIMSLIIIVLLILTIIASIFVIENYKENKELSAKQETMQKDLDKANQTIMEKDKKIQELLEEINKKLEGEKKRDNYYPNTPTPQSQPDGVKYF